MFLGRLMNQTNAPLLEHVLEFTAARHQLIAENMANNQLWQGDQYIASGWLREGCLDEDEFSRQIDAALGTLCYSHEAAASGRKKDVCIARCLSVLDCRWPLFHCEKRRNRGVYLRISYF